MGIEIENLNNQPEENGSARTISRREFLEFLALTFAGSLLPASCNDISYNPTEESVSEQQRLKGDMETPINRLFQESNSDAEGFREKLFALLSDNIIQIRKTLPDFYISPKNENLESKNIYFVDEDQGDKKWKILISKRHYGMAWSYANGGIAAPKVIIEKGKFKDFFAIFIASQDISRTMEGEVFSGLLGSEFADTNIEQEGFTLRIEQKGLASNIISAVYGYTAAGWVAEGIKSDEIPPETATSKEGVFLSMVFRYSNLSIGEIHQNFRNSDILGLAKGIAGENTNHTDEELAIIFLYLSSYTEAVQNDELTPKEAFNEFLSNALRIPNLDKQSERHGQLDNTSWGEKVLHKDLKISTSTAFKLESFPRTI